jgi:hypothetical protein
MDFYNIFHIIIELFCEKNNFIEFVIFKKTTEFFHVTRT